jgi:hypothetical protein
MVAIALQQTVAFELPQIVTELIQAVLFRGELKRGNNRLVNLLGGPAADLAAIAPYDARVMDLEAG